MVLKDLVKKLQADPEYEEYKSIYDQQMSEIKKMALQLCDIQDKKQIKKLGEVLHGFKSNFLHMSSEQWDSYVNAFQSWIEKASPAEKKQAMNELSLTLQDPIYFLTGKEFLANVHPRLIKEKRAGFGMAISAIIASLGVYDGGLNDQQTGLFDTLESFMVFGGLFAFLAFMINGRRIDDNGGIPYIMNGRVKKEKIRTILGKYSNTEPSI